MLRCTCHCVCCDTRVFLVSSRGEVRAGDRCPGCNRPYYHTQVEDFQESDWLACGDSFLLSEYRGPRVTPRRIRLFGLVCCELVGRGITDPRWKQAAADLERLIEGKLPDDERTARIRQLRHLVTTGSHWPAGRSLAWAYSLLIADKPSSFPVLQALLGDRRHPNDAALNARLAAICRDIVGNPCRPLPFLEERVLAANDGAVVKLARFTDEQRAFDQLPILADALEDGGCGDPDLLAHCRQGGEHVKGCWAVDVILGRW